MKEKMKSNLVFFTPSLPGRLYQESRKKSIAATGQRGRKQKKDSNKKTNKKNIYIKELVHNLILTSSLSAVSI